ncbi:putative metalloprotease CJM1_0395 family protein [Hahella ganghwensis]|uniref:putative metalloprotease CJM1_0395 family protein n=1 Tax=Hahella ganghwensis TaxID=286420 RepID=UPI000376BDCE|nr:putative metalloprotease CJM1_0395 family protein [Hahella ganghwensis]
MLITGSALPVSNTITPYSPPSKAQVSTASVQDLESTLPPVQPLEQASSGSPSGTTPALVYNRFAQLNQQTGDNSAGNTSQSPVVPSEEQVDPQQANVSVDAAGVRQGIEPTEGQQTSGETGQQSSPQSPDRESPDQSQRSSQPAGQISDEELAVISELSSRDREVRSHEQAHLSVGGIYASAPQFSYERGPDGRTYAVAGEVSIDASTVPGNPDATIRKLEQVRRAALAPAEPSPQDRRVAAQANQGIIQARADLAEQQRTEAQESEEQREQQRAAAESDSSATDRRDSQSRAIQTYQELIGIGDQLSDIDDFTTVLDEII